MYRYEEWKYSHGVDEFGNPYPGFELKVELYQYPIVKTTSRGFWIYKGVFFPPQDFELYCSDFKGRLRKDCRFVLLDSRKKFACRTKEEALDSFRARKRAQIKILERRLKEAEIALNLCATEDGLECGVSVYQ